MRATFTVCRRLIRWRLLSQPVEVVGGVSVRWKDRVEHLLNSPPASDKRQASIQAHTGDGEGWQPQPGSHLQCRVTLERARDLLASGELQLVFVRLGAEPDHRDPVGRKILDVVPECAALRSATTRTGDAIPSFGQRFTWLACARVRVDRDSLPGGLGKVNSDAKGRHQSHSRDRHAHEVVGRAVINGNG